jgi:hypothetical protein
LPTRAAATITRANRPTGWPTHRYSHPGQPSAASSASAPRPPPQPLRSARSSRAQSASRAGTQTQPARIMLKRARQDAVAGQGCKHLGRAGIADQAEMRTLPRGAQVMGGQQASMRSHAGPDRRACGHHAGSR